MDANISRSIPDFSTIEEKISIGAITFDEFCDSVSEITENKIDTSAVKELISKKTSITPDLLSVANELKDQYDLWLISDFPQEIQETLLINDGLNKIFSPDNTVLCSESHLANITPDIFFHSTKLSRHPMESCILVDSNSIRAVAAVRSGLSSIIYLDVPRFRRELVLREMLPPSIIDYRPKKL
jgi:FMN phosphatase YigB (HAD superfamily)